jgi:probable rRNA maturation factor
MPMMQHPPIQLEVTVQDCIWGQDMVEDLPPTFAAKPLEAPISPTTWSNWLQTWLTILAPDLSPVGRYELCLRLTTDPEIQSLNATYCHTDQPTDVLSFAATEAEMPDITELRQEQPLYLGDVVISVETAQRQAEQRGHSLTVELAWLASHGLLHLLGWDHPDEASLQAMLDQQMKLMQSVNLSIQYDENTVASDTECHKL